MKKKLIAGFCALAVLSATATAVAVFADRNEELKFNSDGYAVRESEAKTKEVTLINKNKGEVTYEKTTKRDDGAVVDIYRANNDDEYEMINGKLRGFMTGSYNPDNSAARISENEAAAIAMQTIVPYVDDVSQYAATWVKCHGSPERYSVACRRLLSGVPTDDYVMVCMARDGQICYVVTLNEGEFNDVDPAIADGITRELIEAYVKENNKNNELIEYCLAKDEDGYYINVYVNNADGERMDLRYELD